MLGDAFDGAALARGLAALEDDDRPGAGDAHPLLHHHRLLPEPARLPLAAPAGQAVRATGDRGGTGGARIAPEAVSPRRPWKPRTVQ
ncbi:hypothetical protein GCM10010420_35060 [Streptomyces glaucosporus]|uniref:Uncharacterized protein n=1 Tax=Streptomyces glaucosporus TaxID=284044 RepID=A0ABP5VJ26_9ACTN